MALPLETADDAEVWDKECAKMQTEFEKRFPGFGIEEEAEHFFTDSDIRQGHLAYRQRQHSLMQEYVKRLRSKL